jgi:outer membrane protein TolC
MSIAAIALCAALAQAQAPAPSAPGPGLSLEKAVEIALAGNSEVLAARSAVEAARGRTLQLGARPDPRLVAGIEGVPLPGKKRPGDEVEVSLGVEQVFEYPGKRALRAEIGRAGERLAEAELERISLVVAARVKRSYWRAVFARNAIRALERSSERLDALLADLQAKYRAGAAGYADVLRARAEKARLRNQVIEQERELRAAGLDLDELLARPAGEPVELLTEMPFAPLSAGWEGVWEGARATRPSLKIAALREESAAAALKLAGLDRNPDFQAGVFLPSVRPGAWGVSFGLTLPFLRPGRTGGLVREAIAEAEGARIRSAAAERRVRTALDNAYSAAKAAEKQVLVFERSLLRDLEDELRIQLDYFRYGRADAFGVLDLHRTFIMAEVDHLRAVLLYNLALADIEAAGEESE